MTIVPKRSILAIGVTLLVTPVAAADLTASTEPLPPPPPTFYVHAGAFGIFFQTNAQATGGGAFPTTNITIRPVYTLALEAGYFVTPNIAVALSAGVPPLIALKATGFPGTPIFGSNLLGTVRAGPVMGLLQYHFTQFGVLQPYVGAGVGYAVNFGNISNGILTNFSIDQNFAFILQAGADWMLTPNWGVFVDGKKAFYSTDAQGFTIPTNIPVRTHVTLDPWLASAGITFKY
ncbi:MAG TPA: OmpW family outer membrane protein [Methylocella sp.]|nr:OmpW family outer membrane protein [Methylocella sp.]